MENDKKISDFNIWKILGVIPINFNDEDKKIKVRCPLHHDQESSLLIDNVNELSPNANRYSSSKCYVCTGNSNYNVAKYWLKEIGLENNNTNWAMANKMFFKMRTQHKDWWHSHNNYTNKVESTLTIRQYDYITVEQVVLEIFDEQTLNTLNPNWRQKLKYLVDMKELGVEKQNQFDTWSLYFKVSFGSDMLAGGMRYNHNNPAMKALMETKTQTGMIQPFYIQEENGVVNPDNKYHSNVLHTRHNTLFIVEGQKDMLTLRLLGLPAFTLIGGAKAKIKYPEFFINKNVYIIYDNDKAGYEGSQSNALELAPFAKEVRVATNVFYDMDNKEDIFDFFFKYKKTLPEFLSRLKDTSNYEVFSKEKLAAIEREEILKKQEEKELKRIEKIKEETEMYKIDFQSLFSQAEQHAIVQFNARMDEAESAAAKTIYLRPIMNFADHRTIEAQKYFNITPAYKQLESAIDEVNERAKEETGKHLFVVKKKISVDEAGNELYTNFAIERIIDEKDLDVIEAIINTPSFNEGNDYSKAGVWNFVKSGIDSFIKNINRRFKSWVMEEGAEGIRQRAESQGVNIKYNEEEKGEREGTKVRVESISTFISKLPKDSSPIHLYTNKFNKRYTLDFTRVRLYEDHDGKNQGAEDTSGHQSIYRALLPSHLITSKTRIGAKITVYGGKIKDLRSNEPFILGWHFEYRNEIDEFEMTNEVKESLDKFRFKGETLEELKAHQEKMYFLYRYYHKQANMLQHLWETSELTYSSIARSMFDNGKDNPKDMNTTLDVMIIGDTTTGKSFINQDLADLYGVGDEVAFENSTATSLIGGSDTANKNKITLGRIPRNHRGLIALEELSAITYKQERVNMFTKLHDLRRDGDVNISRVSGDIKVRADVRMITVSNPINAGGTVVGTEDFITRSLWDMTKTALDNVAILTRFSFVYCPTKLEHARWIMDPNSRHHRNNVEEIVDKSDWVVPINDDYRTKIKWIWSRAPENAFVSIDIKEYTREQVQKHLKPVLGELGGREIGIYTDNITDQHVISIALAVAASTISTDETFDKVILKEVHIDYAIDFILKIYNEKYTGIPSYLQRMREVNNVASTDLDNIFGDRLPSQHKLWKNKMLTLSEGNDKELRHSLYEIYSSMYEFMLDARGNSKDIAWKHYNDMFKGMALRYNDIKSINLPDPALAKFPKLQDEADMRDGDEFKIAWQQAMIRLKLIKNHPTKQFIFSVEPKFMKLFADIKKKYTDKYDEFNGDLIVKDTGEFKVEGE